MWKPQETWVWSLGQEDPLEEGTATHSSILALRVPWTEEPGGLRSKCRKELDWSDLAQQDKAVYCHPALFNLYAENIMQNPVLDESQAVIKIARSNINNLRYADDTTLMVESEEELKSLLMKVKEESEKLA